jgi:hypothetical protein
MVPLEAIKQYKLFILSINFFKKYIMLHDCYYYKNFYTKKECQDILTFAENNVSEWYKDRPCSGKNLNVFLVDTEIIEHKLKKFFKTVKQTNYEIYGFELYDKPFSINFNVYENDKNDYHFHVDQADPGMASDIKLTAVLNLSPESYNGGKFSMFLKEEKVLNEIDETGSLIIFPSFYFHKVSPVTQGKRITMSAWFYGPNWK